MKRERTFELSLDEAEWVASELPQNDGLTQDLQRWVSQQRIEEEAERVRREERAERFAPVWNHFVWSAFGGYPFGDEPSRLETQTSASGRERPDGGDPTPPVNTGEQG